MKKLFLMVTILLAVFTALFATACYATGNDIAILVNEEQRPGNYEVRWDALNVTSGVYLCKFTAGSFTDVKKMLLLR